ncbi:hypothetical protein RAS2_07720 [Phycisphaerae bacterium RAS2]|nr:hypothetical protein RAS2_07720 [Phycisphaerae bacterium RAS2]
MALILLFVGSCIQPAGDDHTKNTIQYSSSDEWILPLKWEMCLQDYDEQYSSSQAPALELGSPSELLISRKVILNNGVSARGLFAGSDKKRLKIIRLSDASVLFVRGISVLSTYEEIVHAFPGASTISYRGYAAVVKTSPGIEFVFYPWGTPKPTDKPVWIDIRCVYRNRHEDATE